MFEGLSTEKNTFGDGVLGAKSSMPEKQPKRKRKMKQPKQRDVEKRQQNLEFAANNFILYILPDPLAQKSANSRFSRVSCPPMSALCWEYNEEYTARSWGWFLYKYFRILIRFNLA